MLPEERDHRLQQLVAVAHDVPIQVLAVIVIPLVLQHLSDAEEVTELIETADALGALRHSELVSYLVTEPVADSPRPILLSDEADGEAPFTIYKADHPATELDQSFLLVFRTRHVVTLDAASDVESSAGYTGFSSI